ncbi:3-hydroxyacyl-ACP dehydratase FabZ family protein [Maribacter sp. 2307UL18-2]|uniref:3-hydroxyacyl-ACP dehydratase FabZ family protein n=1 Tax=Maribacter sp. 2307UL18-2 TaxID=3386274 RepID=UPI0039BC9196
MTTNEIIAALPYDKPFLFVDHLLEVNADGTKGKYTFREDLDFFRGHFKDYAVTPGVLLTECCAQIGLVCLGIFLLDGKASAQTKIALTSTAMEYYLPVVPNEQVTVTSEKEYFRFHKLKCKVKMHNSEGELICKGVISGMFKNEGNA